MGKEAAFAHQIIVCQLSPDHRRCSPLYTHLQPLTEIPGTPIPYFRSLGGLFQRVTRCDFSECRELVIPSTSSS